MTVSQYLLGVRADWDGLVVDPSIGAEVGEFTVRRQIRGAEYVIHVTNTGVGRASLTVDGVAVDGNQVPYAPAGSIVNVVASVS